MDIRFAVQAVAVLSASSSAEDTAVHPVVREGAEVTAA